MIKVISTSVSLIHKLLHKHNVIINHCTTMVINYYHVDRIALTLAAVIRSTSTRSKSGLNLRKTDCNKTESILHVISATQLTMMDSTDYNVKKYLESGPRFYYVIRHVVSKGREYLVVPEERTRVSDNSNHVCCQIAAKADLQPC